MEDDFIFSWAFFFKPLQVPWLSAAAEYMFQFVLLSQNSCCCHGPWHTSSYPSVPAHSLFHPGCYSFYLTGAAYYIHTWYMHDLSSEPHTLEDNSRGELSAFRGPLLLFPSQELSVLMARASASVPVWHFWLCCKEKTISNKLFVRQPLGL